MPERAPCLSAATLAAQHSNQLQITARRLLSCMSCSPQPVITSLLAVPTSLLAVYLTACVQVARSWRCALVLATMAVRLKELNAQDSRNKFTSRIFMVNSPKQDFGCIIEVFGIRKGLVNGIPVPILEVRLLRARLARQSQVASLTIGTEAASIGSRPSR